jgi:hypothetical protein
VIGWWLAAYASHNGPVEKDTQGARHLNENAPPRHRRTGRGGLAGGKAQPVSPPMPEDRRTEPAVLPSALIAARVQTGLIADACVLLAGAERGRWDRGAYVRLQLAAGGAFG